MMLLINWQDTSMMKCVDLISHIVSEMYDTFENFFFFYHLVYNSSFFNYLNSCKSSWSVRELKKNPYLPLQIFKLHRNAHSNCTIE